MFKVKGFTLVELMVTIAIAAILLVIGAPSLNSLYQSTRADMAARKIHQLIAFARSHAVSTERNVTICHLENGACDNDWSKGITVFVDMNGDNSFDDDDIEINYIDGFDDEDKIDTNRSLYRFMIDGRVNQAGTVAYCPKDYNSVPSKQVVISQTGRVRLIELDTNNCK